MQPLRVVLRADALKDWSGSHEPVPKKSTRPLGILRFNKCKIQPDPDLFIEYYFLFLDVKFI